MKRYLLPMILSLPLTAKAKPHGASYSPHRIPQYTEKLPSFRTEATFKNLKTNSVGLSRRHLAHIIQFLGLGRNEWTRFPHAIDMQ